LRQWQAVSSVRGYPTRWAHVSELSCIVAALFMSLAGYLNSVFIGGVSIFFLMTVLQNFFGSGSLHGRVVAGVCAGRRSLLVHRNRDAGPVLQHQASVEAW
jgi:hypothetical protein